MISIVTCTKDKGSISDLQKNIAATIGVPFELIVVENPRGEFGIAEAYNRGARQSVYPVLCFMHDDVLFESENWGTRVLQHLSDSGTGLVGLAGGDTKGWVPSSWSSSIFPSEVNLVQHYKYKVALPQRIVHTGYRHSQETARRVASLDGVWMCTRRDVFEKYKFDEITFPGFHGYDIDYSLQVGEQFKVLVIFDIVLHHFSEGRFDRSWLEAAIRLSSKWRSKLPRTVRNLKHRELVNQHWTSMRVFIQQQQSMSFPRMIILRNLIMFSCTRYFHWKHFLHFVRIVVFSSGRPQ